MNDRPLTLRKALHDLEDSYIAKMGETGGRLYAGTVYNDPAMSHKPSSGVVLQGARKFWDSFAANWYINRTPSSKGDCERLTQITALYFLAFGREFQSRLEFWQSTERLSSASRT